MYKRIFVGNYILSYDYPRFHILKGNYAISTFLISGIALFDSKAMHDSLLQLIITM